MSGKFSLIQGWSIAPSITVWATWIPLGPSSLAIDWATALNPNFADAKALNPELPLIDAVAPVKIIVPFLFFSIYLAASFPVRKPANVGGVIASNQGNNYSGDAYLNLWNPNSAKEDTSDYASLSGEETQPDPTSEEPQLLGSIDPRRASDDWQGGGNTIYDQDYWSKAFYVKFENVSNINTKTFRNDHTVEMRMTLEIHNIEELMRILARINNTPNIINATRIIWNWITNLMIYSI